MVVFDSTFLIPLLAPEIDPPLDPSTGLPVERMGDRLKQLVDRLTEGRDKIVIPAPVLSEVPAGASAAAAEEYLAIIRRQSVFHIEPFGTRAAIELGEIMRTLPAAGGKRAGSAEPWAKIKFDRQIMSVARVVGAAEVYSDDGGIPFAGAAARRPSDTIGRSAVAARGPARSATA